MNDAILNADTPYQDKTNQDKTNQHMPYQDSQQQSARPSVAPPVYNSVRDPRRKSLFITSLLSIMPGLGHTYVGYYQRGFIHFLVFGCSISLATSGQLDALTPLVGTFVGFFWFFNQIDAIRRATFYNLALDGMQDMPVPDEMSGPIMGGSYVGGMALLVFGLIAISNTLFNLSLEWLDDWWPIAPIALGAYLVYREWQDQQRKSSE